MKKYIFILACFVLSFPMLGQTPLAGNYTIDVNGGGDFNSFSEAIDSLNANGISGSVIFNVAAGAYQEQVSIDSIAGSSEVNTISFVGEDAATTIIQPGMITSEAIIVLENAHYISFQNMGVHNAIVDSKDVFVRILKGSNITVEHCRFYAEHRIDNEVIIIDGVEQLLMDRNTFQGDNRSGIYLDNATDAIISNNTINGVGVGIGMSGNTNTHILGNRIHLTGIFTTGLYVDAGNHNLYVEQNHIAPATFIAYAEQGTVMGMHRVVNNVFRGGFMNLKLPATSTDSLVLLHNTVIGDDIAIALSATDSGYVHGENNLFVATRFGQTLHINGGYPFPEGAIWNHNAYIHADTIQYPLIRVATGNGFEYYHNLDDFRIAYPQIDMDSRYVPIEYLDVSGYHIQSATQFHFGIDTLGVNVDVDGDPRGLFGNAVDVGADEFSGFTGDISHVSGRLFLDENRDGVQNDGELGLSGIKVLDTLSGQLTVTDEHGDYLLYKTDIDAVILTPEQFNGFSVSPVDSMILPMAANVENVDFAYSIDTVFSDFGMDLSFDFRRCFRTINGYITYRNQGTVAEDMIVVSYAPDTLETLESSEPMWDYEVDGTYYWDIEDIGIYESGLIRLRIRMPGVEGLGIAQTFNVGIANKAEEVIVEKQYTDSTACAYDPNDKAVFPAGLGEDHLVLKTDSLEYLIRFQNTGNDTAFNIRIVDQLSAALDWGSFEFISTSHEVRTELNRQTGQLVFYFDDIQLVDSVANEPESHGFVKFRVHPRADIADSTLIENTAYIYFDFNPPIVTNTVSTLMVDEIPEELLPVVASLPDSFEAGALVYPNPTAGTFRIHLPNSELVLLEAFSIDGRMVHRHHYQRQNIALDFSGLTKGVYILKVQADNYHFSEKVIIE